jgi:hypothetical protein
MDGVVHLYFIPTWLNTEFLIQGIITDLISRFIQNVKICGRAALDLNRSLPVLKFSIRRQVCKSATRI